MFWRIWVILVREVDFWKKELKALTFFFYFFLVFIDYSYIIFIYSNWVILMSWEIPHHSQPFAIILALSSYLPSHYLSPIVLLLNSFFSKALKPDNLICPTKTANRWWLLPNIFSAKEFLETILVSSCSIPTVKRLSLLLWSEEEGSPCREL